MATSKTCQKCGKEVMMAQMSMTTFGNLCYSCRRDEDNDFKILRKGIVTIRELITQSKGITGLYLNDNLITWNELEGRLSDFIAAEKI